MNRRYSQLRVQLSDRLPIVIYTNLFLPQPATVWISPQVERLTGYGLDEWIGDRHFLASILHPDDRADVLDEVAASRAELRAFSRDYRIVRRNGEVMWIHDESVPVLDGAGKPELIQGYFVDVTQRKELEQQLLHAQKAEALGRLAAEVAHDFNNHLTAIGGYAALLERLVDGNAAAMAHAREIAATVERAGVLTRRLLDYGRRRPRRPQRVALARVVGQLQPMLERVAGSQVAVVLDLHPAADVLLDPGELEQVVVNLVANARDAMPDGGRVVIRTYDVPALDGVTAERVGVVPGSYVSLTVADDGPGMDAETQRRVFEPFFTTKHDGGGSGLGLSIVDRIVRQAGGAIDLRSAVGHGSRFRVLLPPAPG